MELAQSGVKKKKQWCDSYGHHTKVLAGSIEP